jgi:hypothetical protein
MLRDPKLTPGAAEPGVTQKTIKTTICKRAVIPRPFGT